MPSRIFDEEFIKELESLPAFVARLRGARMEGLKASKDRGGRVEFKDFRSFSDGDDFRAIDWNVYARTEQLFVKEFTRDERLPLYILIDNSRSMAFGEPAGEILAKRAACMLAYMALLAKGEASVSLLAGGRLTGFPPASGPAAVYDVMKFLENNPASSATDVGASVAAFLDRTRGKGIAVLISDFLDEKDFLAPLSRLKARFKDLVIVFVSEKSAGVPAGRLEMLDSETGEAVEAVVTEADRLAYLGIEGGLIERLRGFAASRGIFFVEAPSSARAAEVVRSCLAL